MKFVAAVLLLCFAVTAHSQHGTTRDRMEAVENNLIPFVPIKGFKGWKITDRMKYYKIPGVSIAVIKNYKIDWAKGYGLADTAKKIKVITQTLFSAGSISKFVMAVAALKMVEQGQIKLDAPINNYLQSWKVADNAYTLKTPITLRMLLSHSAGTSQSSYFGFTPSQPLPTVVDILSGAKVSGTRPVVVNSEPKKEFRYSGGGSMIAQLALMDVAKTGFADLTQKLVFDKLDMRHSTFEQPLPEKMATQSAWAYSEAPWFKGMPYVYPQQAAAGLYTTPTDLATFFIEVQNAYRGKGKILSQTTAKLMLTPQYAISDGSYKEQIGVGPFLLQRTDNKDSSGMYFEFTGVNAGFLAYGIAGITNGNGVVIMLNSGDDVNGLGKEIRRAVAKVYNWTNFLPDAIQPTYLSASELDNYTGRYRMSADEVLYLRKEKDYLVENINAGNDIYCFPVTKDTIVLTDYNIKAGFARDERGEVVSLQNTYQQKPMPKMKADEFSPSEYLTMGKYDEAKKGYREMKMNEYQITYLAYTLLNAKPFQKKAVLTILDLATEQHPNSSIVYSRWGDYYVKINNTSTAIDRYRKAVELDPTDEQVKEKLENLIRSGR